MGTRPVRQTAKGLRSYPAGMGTPELWACDRDGSNAVQLTSLGVEAGKHGQSIRGPQWSPDSQRIAFFFIGRDEDALAVINANGGAVRRLAVPGGGKWPSWSRDGRWLYFASNRAPQTIYKIRPTGGVPVQITRDEGDLPQESPDGKFVYYQKGWPLHVSVWRMSVEGGEKTKVIDGVNANGQWTVGADGIYFFTVPDAKGHSDICLYEFATGRIKKILMVERSIGDKIAVSPDARTIFYSQIDEQGSDLMLVENFH
jgi:Tol biopolymer transport system component